MRGKCSENQSGCSRHKNRQERSPVRSRFIQARANGWNQRRWNFGVGHRAYARVDGSEERFFGGERGAALGTDDEVRAQRSGRSSASSSFA